MLARLICLVIIVNTMTMFLRVTKTHIAAAIAAVVLAVEKNKILPGPNSLDVHKHLCP